MPLTRASVTIASRVMLPAYPVFALWIGFIYVTDPDGRLQGSAAFPLLPTGLWGAGFIVCGLTLAAALLSKRRRLYVYGLAPMMVWLVIWAAALAWSALYEGTSFSAPAFPTLAAVAVWASMLSVLAKET